jgi:MFS family permease
MQSSTVVSPQPAIVHSGHSGQSVTVVVVMLSIVSASYSLVQSLVNPALQPLRAEFHTSQSGVGWVLTAYLLSSAVLTPFLGRVGDHVGRERLLVAATGFLVAGSVVAAVAPDLGVLLVGRAIQGAGGAILPLAFGILRRVLPADRVGGAIGTAAALSAVGGGLGLVAAGPILSGLGIRWLFWVPAILNGVVALLLWRTLRSSPPVHSRDRVNYGVAAVMAVSLVCLLLPLSLGDTWGWGSVRTIGLFGAAVAFGTVWVVMELRSDAPLIDMRMMRLPAVWTANLASLLFGVGLYSGTAYLPSFLQTPASAGYGFGASITISGLLTLPLTIGMLLTGLATASLGRRMPIRALMLLGALPPVVLFLMLAFAHTQRWEILLGGAIGGLGFGIALSALSAHVVNAVPHSNTGAAAGMNTNIRTIGGAIGAAIVATILGSHSGGSGVPSEHGWVVAFVVLAIAAAIGAATCLLIPEPETDQGGVLGSTLSDIESSSSALSELETSQSLGTRFAEKTW